MPDILILAVDGDISGIIQRLRSGVPVDACDDFGRTALHEAAARGDVELIETLIKYGANPNAACIDGWTPLCEAARSNQQQAFQRLLDIGGQPDLPEPWSVYEAALRANADINIFRSLLPQLNPDMLNKQGRPIIEAASLKKRSDVVSELIHLGASASQLSADVSENSHKSEIICQIDVFVDVTGPQELFDALLIVGWDIAQLSKNGPIGPFQEFVELRQDENILLRCEIPRPGVRYPYYSIILGAREKFWDAGYYPQLAVFHQKLEITGLSQESGGWISGRAFRYLDRLITLPDAQQNHPPDAQKDVRR